MARKYMRKKTGDISQAGKALSREISQNPGMPMETARSMLMGKAMEDKGHRIDLPDAMREKMETAFGMNFGKVNLYESERVADAGANAIAQGGNIAFAPGKADFNTLDGRNRLGHELSHIASQAREEVTGSGYLNDSALEARADREGALAASGEQVYSGPMMDAPSFSAAAPMQADTGKEEKEAIKNTVQKMLNIQKAMTAQRHVMSAWNEDLAEHPSEKKGHFSNDRSALDRNHHDDVLRVKDGATRGTGFNKIEQLHGVDEGEYRWFQQRLNNPSPALLKELQGTKDTYSDIAYKRYKTANQNAMNEVKNGEWGGLNRYKNAEGNAYSQIPELFDAKGMADIMKKIDAKNAGKSEDYDKWKAERDEGISREERADRERHDENISRATDVAYDYGKRRDDLSLHFSHIDENRNNVERYVTQDTNGTPDGIGHASYSLPTDVDMFSGRQSYNDRHNGRELYNKNLYYSKSATDVREEQEARARREQQEREEQERLEREELEPEELEQQEPEERERREQQERERQKREVEKERKKKEEEESKKRMKEQEETEVKQKRDNLSTITKGKRKGFYDGNSALREFQTKLNENPVEVEQRPLTPEEAAQFDDDFGLAGAKPQIVKTQEPKKVPKPKKSKWKPTGKVASQKPKKPGPEPQKGTPEHQAWKKAYEAYYKSFS